MPDTQSQHLGKYDILAEIGKGGFATVYRARDPDLGREVALKVLDPLLMRDPAWVARFRNEARTIAALEHPRIVPIYEIGQAEGILFIAMKLLESGSLADRIATGPLPWAEIVRLTGEIAEAFDFAHSRKVLHRDLKPANVLLDADGHAVLTDFGFARLVADHSLSVSISGGGVVGTPAYIAPEVWEGEPPGRPADLYALGCIVYEMAAGVQPFTGSTTPAVMRAHFKPLALPDRWPAGTPAGLGDVLAVALAQAPADRFTSAGELAAAVAGLTIDALAEPYATLQAAATAGDWAQARALAGRIRAQKPDYRDVVALEAQALAGQERVARAEQAATWRADAEAALAAGDRSAAVRAAKQWAALTPDDPELVTFKSRLQALAALVEDRERAVEARPAPQVTPEPPPQAAETEPSAETAETPSQAAAPPAKAQPKRRRAWLVPVIGALAILLSCGALQLIRSKGLRTEFNFSASTGTSEPSPAREDVIKIAILAPLSGNQPTFGTVTRDGALLAIEDYAKAHNGGVLGMTIEATVEDSQCSADPAVNAANKVIDQDKIHYIVGEVCSSASIPVSEIANAKKVVQISPTSTNPAVTVDKDGKTKDYIFRACFIDPFQGTVGANFALKTLGAKKAFILYDQSNDYVKGLAEFFEKAFVAGGGTIAGKETYNGKTDTDFSAILAKVADAQPDMIYMPDYYPAINLATKQAKDKGINVPFMGGDGWDSSALDLKAAAGGYFTNHFSAADPRPEVQTFVTNFKAKYNATPDALAALAYDATMILLNAIEKAGVDDPTKVKDAMAATNFSGVSGTVTFDAQHNPIKSATILRVTENGLQFHSVVNP